MKSQGELVALVVPYLLTSSSHAFQKQEGRSRFHTAPADPDNLNVSAPYGEGVHSNGLVKEIEAYNSFKDA